MMSDIEQLPILIKKEQERGDELEGKMTNERRLPEEAEDKKMTIIRKMLQQQLEELKEQNMMKEQKLIEIQKRNVCMLEEVYELEEKFAASKVFTFILYFLIFTSVFTYSYVIFICVCYSDLVSFIFLIF